MDKRFADVRKTTDQIKHDIRDNAEEDQRRMQEQVILILYGFCKFDFIFQIVLTMVFWVFWRFVMFQILSPGLDKIVHLMPFLCTVAGV